MLYLFTQLMLAFGFEAKTVDIAYESCANSIGDITMSDIDGLKCNDIIGCKIACFNYMENYNGIH